jgi:signal transduction histidine kinase
MQSFPPLSHENRQWSLPMSDATCGAIVESLAVEQTQRVAILQDAFCADPVFACWVTCRAGRFLKTAREAADWLSERLLNELSTSEQTPTTLETWEESVRTSLAVANIASTLAADSSHAEECQWLGLLHNVRAWPEVIEACLPDEFAQQLTSLEANDSSHEVATYVRKAASMLGNRRRRQGIAVGAVLDQAATDAQAWGRTLFRTQGSFATLLDRVSTSNDEQAFDERLHHEKLASLRELTYGISHDINNPLANISSRAQMLLRDETDGDRRRLLSMIHSHAMRAHEMITEMALFARPPQLEPESFDLRDVITEVLSDLQQTAESAGVELVLSPELPRADIVADRTQVAVLVHAIVSNGIEAIRRVGRSGFVKVALQSEADAWQLSITNDGPGLNDRERRHLFDPYFCGYETGRGMGMGLSKSWQIVKAHEGTIRVDSQTDADLSMIIHLPRGDESKIDG